jgi:SulP family sulfate permease
LILALLSPALTVAMLGAIESLMSAVVADRMSGDRHNPNVELVAQGVANIVSPLFGGLPATGAIARTATNVRSGARTPVAGMIHALTLLGLLLFGAGLAGHVPMAVLAAILFVVAANMGEWHEIPLLLRQTKTDVAVWVTTFALTVLADLTVAVEVGMILAALLYIRRVSSTTTVDQVTPEYLEAGRVHILQDKHIPDYVTILRIHGPFLFGTADKLQGVVDRLETLTPIVIFRLRNMTAIDATGLRALEDLTLRLRDSGRTAVFCGAREQPRAVMEQAGFFEMAGAENVCPNVDAALDRARALHDRLSIAS